MQNRNLLRNQTLGKILVGQTVCFLSEASLHNNSFILESFYICQIDLINLWKHQRNNG